MCIRDSVIYYALIINPILLFSTSICSEWNQPKTASPLHQFTEVIQHTDLVFMLHKDFKIVKAKSIYFQILGWIWEVFMIVVALVLEVDVLKVVLELALEFETVIEVVRKLKPNLPSLLEIIS